MEFRGTGDAYLGFLILHGMLVLVTCGIYGFWFASARRKWMMERTFVHGQPLRHEGQLGDYALTWAMSTGLTILTLGLYRPWAKTKMERYTWRNTRVGDGRSCRFEGSGIEYLGIGLGAMAVRLIPFGIGKGLAAHMRTKWERSSLWIGGQRVKFTGGAGELIGMNFLGGLLLPFTLGFYYPWHVVKVEKWKCRHSIVPWGEDRSAPSLDPMEMALLSAAKNPNTWRYGLPAVAGIALVGVGGLAVAGAMDDGLDEFDHIIGSGNVYRGDDEPTGDEYYHHGDDGNVHGGEFGGNGVVFVPPEPPAVPMPPPLRALVDCLGGTSNLNRLTYADVESTKNCLTAISTTPSFQAEQMCSANPEEVWRAEGAWDTCTLQPTGRSTGIVRFNAVFRSGGLAAVTMSSTRESVNGCAEPPFAPYARSAAALGASRGFETWQVGDWIHRFESSHTEAPGLSLVEDRYTMLRTDVLLTGSLAPEFQGLSVSDVNVAQGAIPSSVWSAMADLGFDMGCPAVYLPSLVGQSSESVLQQCPNLERTRAYMHMPGERLRPRARGRAKRGRPKVALAGLGSPAIITEVLVDLPDKGQALWKETSAALGPSTKYDCTGHVWRQGAYVVRVRPGGGRLRIAWTPIGSHEAFGWVAPRAGLSPSWR